MESSSWQETTGNKCQHQSKRRQYGNEDDRYQFCGCILCDGGFCGATGASWVGGSGGTIRRWNDPKIEKDASGRRKFIIRTPLMPTDAVNPKLHFFAKKPATGKIVYSDIELTLSPREYNVRIANSAYANSAANGDVRFVATFMTDPDSEPADSLSGTFVFKDSA